MSNRGFISHKSLTLEKNGTYKNENVTGQVFICSRATFIFEMQFNDGGWFDWDQGLQFNIAPDQFTKKKGIEGVLVIEATPGGPAEKAGIRPTRRNENGDLVSINADDGK